MTTTIESAIAETGMLIRKPVTEVFEAFTNPDITTKFWFTKSSGKLEPGKHIRWTWEMYNHTVDVHVKRVEPNKSILIEWGTDGERTSVEWTFWPVSDNSTFVKVVNSGFEGGTDRLISQVQDSTGGFSLVLAGLKAYLEHGIQLNLIADRFPEGK